MRGSVTVLRRERVSVVSINNPPVNALSGAVRAGLDEALQSAIADRNVQAVVLAGNARAFSAGADIAEFEGPPRYTKLNELNAVIEGAPKPVIAALEALALGGGLELALACHFRIASRNARLGFPEINLGLIPGAGGTQLLPRLIGVEQAVKMILSGRPVSAEQAHAWGLVDEIVDDGDLVGKAINFIQRKLADNGSLRRARDNDAKLAEARADPSLIDRVAVPLLSRMRGQRAPAAAVTAIRLALDTPYEEALAKERAIFVELMNSEQSLAQRHLFFAEREAARIPGFRSAPEALGIERTAVIGGGLMGSGIALCFATAGIAVTVVEANVGAAVEAKKRIDLTLRRSAAYQQMSEKEIQRLLAMISVTADLNSIGSADLVIEAVFEDLPLKQGVFFKLDRFAKTDALLATNTSYLDIDALAAQTHRPQRVLGMHFFSPAHIMPLVEVVRASETSLTALATGLAVSRRIGKTPVAVGACEGFVGNRMLQTRYVGAERLLLEGTLPHEVDTALVAFGFPMGPFALEDLCGLEISWSMRRANGLRAEIADKLCEAGRFGRKSKKGFYLYDDEGHPAPDAFVEQIICESSARHRIERRPKTSAEITERLIFPMINEAARILEEGVAYRPGDIDVIWVRGFGWPVWRGGPLYFADQLGLSYVRGRLLEWRVKPAPLLDRLVRDGGTFATLPVAVASAD